MIASTNWASSTGVEIKGCKPDAKLVFLSLDEEVKLAGCVLCCCTSLMFSGVSNIVDSLVLILRNVITTYARIQLSILSRVVYINFTKMSHPKPNNL